MCNSCNSCCRRKFCNTRLKTYALGAPIVGTEQVVYALWVSLCELTKRGLFYVSVPASTTSTLPPVVQLCNGQILPIVFSGTAEAAQASGLIGNRLHLATITCIEGVPTLNIFDAQNAAA
jgi:hypothetical protein